MLSFLFVVSSFMLFQAHEYIYQPQKGILVTGFVGDKYYQGVIASDGSFVPDLQKSPGLLGQTGSDFLAPHYRIAAKPNERVYEYRSGYLIPMVFVNKYELIPEVGGIIIDFKDYHYSPTARRIYNLPGRFVLKKDDTAKKP
jgi:hypothetical protein